MAEFTVRRPSLLPAGEAYNRDNAGAEAFWTQPLQVSGVLDPPRGGTGVTSLAALKDALGVGVDADAGLTVEQVRDILGLLIQDSATIDATYDDAGALETLSVKPNTSQQKVAIQRDGSAVGLRQTLNFIQGSNVTLAVADNGGADRVDLTINATGGVSGGLTAEDVDDRVASLLVAGTGVSLNYNDTGNTITISSTGVSGPANQNTFDTRSLALAASIDPGISWVETKGFSAAGDGGHGLYRYRSTAPADVNNPAYFRSASLRWFELVSQGGVVRIEQFGGRGDWNGTTGTDNLGPLNYAMAYDNFVPTAFALYTKRIWLGHGKYYFSDTLEVRRIAQVYGNGSSRDAIGEGGPTKLFFPPNKTGIILQGRFLSGEDTIDGSLDGNAVGGSVIEGVSLHWTGPSTDLTKSGIKVRSQVTLRGIHIHDAPGNAIWIRGGSFSGGGNANHCEIHDITVHSCGGHGLVTEGSDANGCTINNFETRPGVAKCGILEASGLGNNYSNLKLAGYGIGGVSYAGNRYQFIITGSVATAADVPGVSGKWVYREPGGIAGEWPAWDSSKTYGLESLHCPIFATGFSNLSRFFGYYIEDIGQLSHLDGPMIAQGGYGPFTRNSAVLGNDSRSLSNNCGFSGIRGFNPIDPGYAKHGGFVRIMMGGIASTGGGGVAEDMDLLLIENDTSGRMVATYGSGGAAIDFRWQNGPLVMRWHSPSNTIVYDRNSGPVNIVGFRDILLNEPAGGVGGAIIMGLRYAVPTDPGEYHRGDRYLNGNPSPGGAEGWVCTTSGVISNAGTWTAGGVYSGGDIVVSSAGRYYRNKSFGAATAGNEPVHTSGTVTTGDGLHWAYLGNSAPVFHPFGSIAA